jgi:hypothetical protein
MYAANNTGRILVLNNSIPASDFIFPLKLISFTGVDARLISFANRLSCWNLRMKTGK